MEEISKLLENREFKVVKADTLFELDMRDCWKTGRCIYPNCGNKLKITRRGSAYCTSKKHPKLFIKKFK